MKRFPLLLAVIGFLAVGGAGRVHAQTARALLDALPAQIRAEAEARKKSSPAPTSPTPNYDYLISLLRAARTTLDSNDDNTAAQQLQIVQGNGASNALRDACDTIIRKIHQERADQQAAATAAIADMLKRAGESVIHAQTAKDLDATILELSHAADDAGLAKTFENRSEPYTRRLQVASAFVTRWQDALGGINRVEGRNAPENFRSLLYSDNSSAMESMNIPRSELLARIPAPPAPEPTPTPIPTPARREEPVPRPAAEINAGIAAVLDKLHSLDDLPLVIRALTALRDEAQNYNGNRPYGARVNTLGGFILRLHDLEQVYAELQNGLDRAPVIWWNNNHGSENELPDENLLVPLRAQLLMLALPRLLNAPDTEKPAAGERVNAFLTRLINAARHRGDWPTVARGLEYRRQLLNPREAYDGSFRGGDARDDSAAFKPFFAGQNFEQAAQWEQAVASYLTALGTGSQEIPVAFISERLAAIRKEHPKDYDGGAHAVGPDAGEASYENALRMFRGRMPPVSLEHAVATAAATPAPSATPTPAPVKSPSPSPSPSASPSATP